MLSFRVVENVARGLVRCEAAQDQLGDARGELVVDRASGDEQSVEERPAEHVERKLEVEVGGQVAALDAAFEHRSQRRPSSGQEAIANRVG